MSNERKNWERNVCECGKKTVKNIVQVSGVLQDITVS